MKNKSRKEQISKKIATLIREGLDKEQATTIAYNMFKDGGNLPSYQDAGGFPFTPKNPWEVAQPVKPNQVVAQPPTKKAAPYQQAPNPFQTPQQPADAFSAPKVMGNISNERAQWDSAWNKRNSTGMGITDPNSVLNYQTPQTSLPQDTAGVTLSPDQLADGSPMADNMEMFTSNEQRNRMAQNNVENTANNGYDRDGNAKPFQRTREENLQFFNPYGGVDIPTSAYLLGQGIESGDTLGIATSGLKLATGLGRNLMSGMGQARRRNYVMQDFQEKAKEASQPMWQQEEENGGYFEMGGQYTLPYKQWDRFAEPGAYMEQMTSFQDGGMQQPSPEEVIMAFAELTQQDPQLIMEQLQGLSPEEQQQALQQMMEALSQPQAQEQQPPMMQEGGEFQKTLTGEYTAEDPTAKETEKVAELEVNEYLQKPDGSITKILGEKHSNGGVELTDNQIPDGSKVISDHLKVENSAKEISEKFDLKINKTDTYAKVLDKWTKKSGLQDLVDEEEAVIKKLEKETRKVAENPQLENTTKINLDFLQKQLNEISTKKEPLEEQRAEVFSFVFEKQEQSKPVGEGMEEKMQQGGQFNGDMLVEYSNKYGIPQDRIKSLLQEYQNGGLAKYQGGGERFDDFYDQAVSLGYAGNKQIGEIQTWMTKNHPQEVVNYYRKSGQPMNASHVDILKAQSKDVFQKAGIDPNKPSASYTSEEKAKLAEVAGESLDDNFWLEGFQDNKWDWRAPVLGVNARGLQNPRGMTGQGIVAGQIPSNLYIPQSPQQGEEKIVDGQTASSNRGILLLPDQSPMLPDSLQPALKATRRYDRVEAPLMSPDALIQEIRRQEQTAMSNLQGLPDAQRASAAAQVQANTQAELNKVMSQVEGQNLMSRTQANQFNAQTQRAEEDARVSDLMSYEQRILMADAKTQANLRNYYNTMKQQNVANYNTVQNVNLLNQMYPNMAYTGDQVVATNLQDASDYSGISQKTAAQRIEEDKLSEQKRKKEQKKAVAKKGGRFKTKY